ncbi:MAG: YdcF family protein [Lachnospiraceae bacterium]|nr:YdcF family protein [Lachnospiraceae bacterium]
MRKLWFGKWKWLKRILIVGVGVGILGLVMVLGLNWYMKTSVRDSLYSLEDSGEVGKVDCILILGARAYSDGTPSLVLKDRLDRGIELYKKGISDRILMSGDHGREEYDEVRAMKQYAVEAGVPAENIFMDHAGFSTYESMYRARDVFEVKSLVIVTQPYHSYRALYDARGLGLNAYGIPSKETTYQGSWILECREKLARVKDFVWMIIKPEPTYLGESIPITGTAAATDDEGEGWDQTEEKRE